MKKFIMGVMFAIVMMIAVGCSTNEHDYVLRNYKYNDEGIIDIYKDNDVYVMEERLIDLSYRVGTIYDCHIYMTMDKAALEGWLETENIGIIIE